MSLQFLLPKLEIACFPNFTLEVVALKQRFYTIAAGW
jgi:hypothetical protein